MFIGSKIGKNMYRPFQPTLVSSFFLLESSLRPELGHIQMRVNDLRAEIFCRQPPPQQHGRIGEERLLRLLLINDLGEVLR